MAIANAIARPTVNCLRRLTWPCLMHSEQSINVATDVQSKWASCEVTDLDQAEHSDSDDQPSSLEKGTLRPVSCRQKQSVGAVRRTAAQ